MRIRPERVEVIPEGRERSRVRLMRPEEGRRLKAFIVPAPGADSARLKREVKNLIKDALTPPERPVIFTLGASLPKSNFGKDRDW